MQENTILNGLLNQAIIAEIADKGNIQLYNPDANELTIVAQFGFEESFLKYFATVKPFDTSACGRAFGIGGPVLINNIETDISFAANRVEGMKAGFRSVKSVPVFNSNNICLGVVSTHFAELKRYWDTQAIDSLLPEIALELEKLQNSSFPNIRLRETI